MPHDLKQRVRNYLQGGGLFNPELANHDAVRDLIMDLDAAIPPSPEQETLRKALAEVIRQMRSDGARYKSHPLGYEDSVSSSRVDEWADEIETALASPPPAGASSERVQQLEQALDAADRLMARYINETLPVVEWQEWRREHRDALCDVAAGASPATCEWRRLPMSEAHQPDCMGENTNAAMLPEDIAEWKVCPYCTKPLSLASGRTEEGK